MFLKTQNVNQAGKQKIVAYNSRTRYNAQDGERFCIQPRKNNDDLLHENTSKRGHVYKANVAVNNITNFCQLRILRMANFLPEVNTYKTIIL